MPEVIAPPDYEPQAQVRTVAETGLISFKGRYVRCSKAFAGKRVPLRATANDGIFDICYRSHVLAQVDVRQNIAQTVLDVPERPSSIYTV